MSPTPGETLEREFQRARPPSWPRPMVWPNVLMADRWDSVDARSCVSAVREHPGAERLGSGRTQPRPSNYSIMGYRHYIPAALAKISENLPKISETLPIRIPGTKNRIQRTKKCDQEKRDQGMAAVKTKVITKVKAGADAACSKTPMFLHPNSTSFYIRRPGADWVPALHPRIHSSLVRINR